jgi:hypothetical protein
VAPGAWARQTRSRLTQGRATLLRRKARHHPYGRRQIRAQPGAKNKSPGARHFAGREPVSKFRSKQPLKCRILSTSGRSVDPVGRPFRRQRVSSGPYSSGEPGAPEQDHCDRVIRRARCKLLAARRSLLPIGHLSCQCCRVEFECDIWLALLDRAASPESIRAFWNVKENDALDTFRTVTAFGSAGLGWRAPATRCRRSGS